MWRRRRSGWGHLLVHPPARSAAQEANPAKEALGKACEGFLRATPRSWGTASGTPKVFAMLISRSTPAGDASGSCARPARRCTLRTQGNTRAHDKAPATSTRPALTEETDHGNRNSLAATRRMGAWTSAHLGGARMTSMHEGIAPSVHGSVALHPDDILLGILTLSPGPGTGKRLFPASSPRLHRLFDELRGTTEASGVLDAFEVAEGAPYPYSPQLARSLAHLERSRLIGKHNPDFEQFFVDEDAAGVFARRVRPRLRPGMEGRLRDLAVAFWSRLEEARA